MDSAGNHVEAARFDFQSIYKLRGKVDQVYDCSTQDLLKKDVINDLSRILGLSPGKNDGQDPLIDNVFILTDADPDGLTIVQAYK